MDLSKNTGYRVPEDYFGTLETRLAAIADAPSATRWQRLRPLVALAASFAVLVSAGTFLLRHTTPAAPADSLYESLYLEDILPLTGDGTELLSDNSLDRKLTDEEIAQYLIESGETLDQIAYSYENPE